MVPEGEINGLACETANSFSSTLRNQTNSTSKYQSSGDPFVQLLKDNEGSHQDAFAGKCSLSMKEGEDLLVKHLEQ